MVYAFLFSAVSVLFRIIFSFRVLGRENLTAYKKNGRPFVICSNHISMLDPVFIAMAWGIGRKLSIMGKAELFRNPFLAWIFTKVGVFPVDRGKGDASVIEKAMEDVRSGRGMLIFPEGTRGDGRKMARFKSGAFLVAAGTGADVVPVRVIYPSRDGKLRFFAPAVLSFGPAVTAEELNLSGGSKRALRQAKNTVRDRIEGLFGDYCNESGYTPPRILREAGVREEEDI